MRTRVRCAAIVAALIATITIAPTAATAAAPASAERIAAAALLGQLRVEAPSTATYNRDLFAEGQDLDGDGCRTRQEVLLDEALTTPAVTGRCTVGAGEWYSYYDGVSHTDPTALEMDHLVALKETWASGAWSWTDAQRAAYANDTEDPRTLVMVTGAVNTAKSDKDPTAWLPPRVEARCTYVAEWVAVKWRWNLSVDVAEKAAIEKVLSTCAAGDAEIGMPAEPSGGRPATASAETPVVADPVPVYRFYSPVFKGHFFTTSASERDMITTRWPRTWTYEGQRYSAYETQQPGTVPLYRFWSAKYNGHFFTADRAERDRVIRTWPSTWAYEGVAYYVYPMQYAGSVDTVPVARFWSAKAKHHFYTASAAESDFVKSRWSATWAYEKSDFRVPNIGVPAFVAPAPAPKPPAPKPPAPKPTRPANPGDTKNCSDFRTYAEAKAWFDKYYPHYGDVARLDHNNDRIPCESLPGSPKRR